MKATILCMQLTSSWDSLNLLIKLLSPATSQVSFNDRPAIKIILETNKFLDPDRVAIYGWSYGGYMTSNTLGKDGGNTFQCGVAVAPLADWRYYDTIYAERYMGDPNVDGNKEGYVKGSIVDGHESSQFENVDYIHN